MTRKTIWECNVCGDEFDTKKECLEHEVTHAKRKPKQKKKSFVFDKLSIGLNIVGFFIGGLLLHIPALILAIISWNKKQKRAKLALILSIIGIVISSIILITTFDPSQFSTDTTSKKSNMFTDADELVADFLNNPLSAKQRYLNRVVEVEGPIVYITDEFGFPSVSIGSVVFQAVMCAPNDKSSVYDLNTGDYIYVTGTITGLIGQNILLEDCFIFPEV